MSTSLTNKLPRRILILGCGGFIGSHLIKRLLADSTSKSHITGIDLTSDKIKPYLGHKKFSFFTLDIHNNIALRTHIKQSDVVISLAAICNPALYNTQPLRVIDANYTGQSFVVKLCAELDKWLIQFSTSEVYGKTAVSVSGQKRSDSVKKSEYILKEESTPLILGPIAAQRWTYACAKQLLERLVFAYSQESNLKYTIVRPFNFIGPQMDFIPGIDGEGIPRVLACFMDALLFEKPLQLVDGGKNKRVFTYIDDAIDAIIRILQQPQKAQGKIFNIGNPANEIDIAGLATLMKSIYLKLRPDLKQKNIRTITVAAEKFYGKGYDDSDRRVPAIANAKKLLGWRPKTDLKSALTLTIQSYIDQYAPAVFQSTGRCR